MTLNIVDSLRRLEDAVARRPGFGVGTSTSRTRLPRGLRATTDEADWTIETDVSSALGGTASAPSPSVLLRAALGSCMAMSYRLRAERAGVAIGAITVTVETDAAIEGMLVLDADVPPGFTGVRFHVEIESDAAETDVLALLDEGDRLSPILDALGGTNTVSRTASILPMGGH